jgi:hypothetical protein
MPPLRGATPIALGNFFLKLSAIVKPVLPHIKSYSPKLGILGLSVKTLNDGPI